MVWAIIPTGLAWVLLLGEGTCVLLRPVHADIAIVAAAIQTALQMKQSSVVNEDGSFGQSNYRTSYGTFLR